MSKEYLNTIANRYVNHQRKSCIEDYHRAEDEESIARWQKKYDPSTIVFNKDLFVKFMNEAVTDGRLRSSGTSRSTST